MKPKMPLSIPNDVEAEQALLGAILEDNIIFDETVYILSPETFFKTAHQYIYAAYCHLKNSNIGIDEITVGDRLRSMSQLEEVGGYAYLAELPDMIPSSGNPLYWAQILEEHAILRRLIDDTQEIGRRARDPEQNVTELLIEAQQKILEISNSKVTRKTHHIKKIIAGYLPKLEERSERESDFVGIPTGFNDLDNFLCGLEDGKLYILAARPAMGKSAAASNIVEHVNTKNLINGASLIFTFEMSEEQEAIRLITSNQNINGRKFRTAKFDSEDWDKLAMAIDQLSGHPIYINKDSKNIVEACHEARLLHRQVKGGVRLIVFDYLQLMCGSKKNSNREQEISEISRSMKNLASELNCPIIALSQLNREVEKRSNKIPQLSDLRESGSIEQDADAIIFIYREDYYRQDDENYIKTNLADFIIAKQREGPTGVIQLCWLPKRTKFFNKPGSYR